MPEIPFREFRGSGFTVQAPVNWQDAAVSTISGPPEDGFRPNVVVSSQEAESDRDSRSLAQEHILVLRQRLPKFQLLKEGPLTVGGFPAYEAEFDWVDEKGRTLSQRQVYILERQKAYVLTATCLSQRRPILEDTLRSIIRSFRST